MTAISGLEGNELEKDLKEIETKMLVFNKLYERMIKEGSEMDEEVGKYYNSDLPSILNSGVQTLYQQNKILIQQNQEIIKYLQEQKK